MTDILIAVESIPDVGIDVLGSTITTTIVETAMGNIDGGFASARYLSVVVGGFAIDGGDAFSVFDGPTIDGGDAGPPSGVLTDYLVTEALDVLITEVDDFLGWE